MEQTQGFVQPVTPPVTATATQTITVNKTSHILDIISLTKSVLRIGRNMDSGARLLVTLAAPPVPDQVQTSV